MQQLNHATESSQAIDDEWKLLQQAQFGAEAGRRFCKFVCDSIIEHREEQHVQAALEDIQQIVERVSELDDRLGGVNAVKVLVYTAIGMAISHRDYEHRHQTTQDEVEREFMASFIEVSREVKGKCFALAKNILGNCVSEYLELAETVINRSHDAKRELSACPRRLVIDDDLSAGAEGGITKKELERRERIIAWGKRLSLSGTTYAELLSEVVGHFRIIARLAAGRLASCLPEETGVTVDDLTEEGCIACRDSLRTFEPNRGIKFETFVAPRMRGRMLDALRLADWAPRLERGKIRNLDNAREELESKLRRRPSDEELTEHCGIKLDEVFRLSASARQLKQTSLSKKYYETEGGDRVDVGDLIEDNRASDPSDDTVEQLQEFFTKSCNRQEELIIILYYWEELTMKEIGAVLDLSESRVSQMHSALVQRLASNPELRSAIHRRKKSIHPTT